MLDLFTDAPPEFIELLNLAGDRVRFTGFDTLFNHYITPKVHVVKQDDLVGAIAGIALTRIMGGRSESKFGYHIYAYEIARILNWTERKAHARLRKLGITKIRRDISHDQLIGLLQAPEGVALADPVTPATSAGT